jgi:hypothetical protein
MTHYKLTMRSNTLIAACALTAVAVAVPLPTTAGSNPLSDTGTQITDLLSSPFGNGNGNGNGNVAGVGNDGNVSRLTASTEGSFP